MPTFDTRRRLSTKENLLVAGGAVAAAGAVFYLGRIMLQRTPLQRQASAVRPTRDMVERGATAEPASALPSR